MIMELGSTFDYQVYKIYFNLAQEVKIDFCFK